MFIDILIKTIVDAFPLLMGILAIMAVIWAIVFVGTYDDRPATIRTVRPTMDMVNSSRYLSLE
jgi:hypothetical protein